MSKDLALFAEERPRRILEILAKEGRLDVHALAARMKVSLPTIRRDLTAMEADGRIVRVHGGVLHPKSVHGESPLTLKRGENVAAKRAMAAAAAALVPPGASVFMDSGTTTLEVARALFPRRDVRIITNSVPLLAEALSAGVPVLCTGGELRALSGALVGAPAELWISKLNVQVSFVGASGLDARGAWTTETMEADTKTRILAAGVTRILVADASKWDVPHTVLFAGWERFHHWVCDKAPPAEECKKIEVAGCRVTAG